MANLVFDFLHNYHAGERRNSEPANTYQYDEGHVIEANLPQVITSCEIHYWIRGMEEAEAYVPTSITPNSDGTCTVIGHVPNEYFRTNGELRVYIVVTDGDASITTYEGRIQVYPRSMPDDYVDDDPDNEATRVLIEAQEAAATATAAAETCEEVLESIPEDYSTLSDDVSDLKDGLSDLENVVARLSGVPTNVRQAIYTLLDKAVYTETGLTDEIATVESWAQTVTDITLNNTTISIFGASTSQLIATTVPSGGAVTWISSDTSVATVSNTGLVTGVGNGTATITASCGELSAKCTATVSGFATVTGIEATYTQTATITTSSSLSDLVPDLVVVATYDDSSTAVVSSDKYVLSGTLEEGTSTITVTYGGFVDTFDVNVLDSTIIYSLSETVFDGTNGIDTGIKNSELITSDGTTLVIDFEDTANTNTGEARVIWSNHSTAPYSGFNITAFVTRNQYNCSNLYYGGAMALSGATTNNSNRIKLVARMQVSADRTTSSSIVVDYTVNGVRKQKLEDSRTFSSAGDNDKLLVGYGLAGNHWAGTVHSLQVYSKLLTDTEVDELLA